MITFLESTENDLNDEAVKCHASTMAKYARRLFEQHTTENTGKN